MTYVIVYLSVFPLTGHAGDIETIICSKFIDRERLDVNVSFIYMSDIKDHMSYEKVIYGGKLKNKR